jgi:hypothetical protein
MHYNMFVPGFICAVRMNVLKSSNLLVPAMPG